MAEAVLYAETNLVCILLLLLISIKVNRAAFLHAQRKQFLIVSVSNILLFLLDVVWIFAESSALPISYLGNWLLNGAYYALGGLLGYFWFCYSETIQQSRFATDIRYRVAGFMPALLLMVLVVLSYKTKLLFYIDANNQYQRGPAYFVQVLISFGYIVLTAGKAFYLSFRASNHRERLRLRTLSAFILPSLFSGILQVFFPRYPILCVGNTVGILYVYLTLQEQLISVDSLTQLNNRTQLFQFLSTKLPYTNDAKSLYLLIMDIDYFKRINDQYGHIEGDRALRLVADCLKRCCDQKNFFISRYGGDEFIVICELDATSSIESVCELIHATLKNAAVSYVLTVSIGVAKYTTDIASQQALIALADQSLYQAKRLRHKTR